MTIILLLGFFTLYIIAVVIGLLLIGLDVQAKRK